GLELGVGLDQGEGFTLERLGFGARQARVFLKRRASGAFVETRSFLRQPLGLFDEIASRRKQFRQAFTQRIAGDDTSADFSDEASDETRIDRVGLGGRAEGARQMADAAGVCKARFDALVEQRLDERTLVSARGLQPYDDPFLLFLEPGCKLGAAAFVVGE